MGFRILRPAGQDWRVTNPLGAVDANLTRHLGCDDLTLRLWRVAPRQAIPRRSRPDSPASWPSTNPCSGCMWCSTSAQCRWTLSHEPKSSGPRPSRARNERRDRAHGRMGIEHRVPGCRAGRASRRQSVPGRARAARRSGRAADPGTYANRSRRAARRGGGRRRIECSLDHGSLVGLGLSTGLRLGELLGLPWGAEGLYITASVVRVRRSLDRTRGPAGGLRSSRRSPRRAFVTYPLAPLELARARRRRWRPDVPVTASWSSPTSAGCHSMRTASPDTAGIASSGRR